MSDFLALDTSATADRIQRSVFVRMGGARRLEAAVRISEEMRATLEAGVRVEVLRLLYGDRIARGVEELLTEADRRT